MDRLAEQVSSDSQYLIIPFPAGEKAISKMGVWREVYDGDICNAKVADAGFWKLSLTKQLRYICTILDNGKNNYIIFSPGTKILKYMPEKLIREIKKIRDVACTVVCMLADGIERVAKNKGLTPIEYLEYFKCLDMVYTYDIYEANKYKIPFAPLPLKKFDFEENIVQQEKVFL